jgi:RHS repeat-associated protein
MKFIKLSLLATGLLFSLNSFASPLWTAVYGASEGNPTKTVTSPNGVTTYSYREGFGEPLLLNNSRSPVSSEGTYDNVGRLLSIAQDGKVRDYNYSDSVHLNWLMSQVDPEIGTTTYTYYKNGLRKSESVSGTSANFTYDANGNATQVSYSSPASMPNAPTINYDYDANNNVSSKIISGSNKIINSYDELNSILSSTLTYGTHTESIAYTYDGYENLKTVTYPDGLVINYNPDGLGRSQSLISPSATIASGITYSPANNVTGYTGVDFRSTITYDTMDRIKNITTTSSNNTYGYDDENNITRITDGNKPSDSESFTYDTINRLKTATGSLGQSTYVYDNGNNITSLTSDTDSNTYSYNGNNLLDSVNSYTKGDQRLEYDTNGNVIKSGNDNFVYDSANHLISFNNSEHNISFDYDPSGHVISTTQDAKIPVITYYDESGKLVYKLDGNKTTEQVTDYIYLNGKLVAEARHDEGDLTDVSYRYITTNAIGSPIASTLGGVTEWTQVYRPYGVEKTPQESNHVGFTGKEVVKDMNLVNMDARYYSPNYGRFMAYDPAEPTVDNLFSFNRYSYANNNPLLYTDPTGMFSWNSFFQGPNDTASGFINGFTVGYGNTSHNPGVAYDAGRGVGVGVAMVLEYGTIVKIFRTIKTSATVSSMAEKNMPGQANVAKNVTKIEYDSKGQLISREPKSLQDQMALDGAKRGLGVDKTDLITKGKGLGNPQYSGMRKMAYTLESSHTNRNSTVHYVKDTMTGELHDFKFKNHFY